MTKPPTHADPSINIATIKLPAPAQDTAHTWPTVILQRMTSWFWSYTDATAKTDTSSFKGIL